MKDRCKDWNPPDWAPPYVFVREDNASSISESAVVGPGALKQSQIQWKDKSIHNVAQLR